MTKREFLNTVINETVNNDVAEYAVTELQKMDERNAKRATKPSKKSIENEPIKEQIAEVLTDTPQSAAEIGAQVGISTSKASALLRQMDGVEVVADKRKNLYKRA